MVLEERAGNRSGQKKRSPGRWAAPYNQSAYCEQDAYCRAEYMEGNPIEIFTTARGKYLRTMDEDFPLFLKSIFHSAGQLLSGIDTDLGRSSGTPAEWRCFSDKKRCRAGTAYQNLALCIRFIPSKSFFHPASEGTVFSSGETPRRTLQEHLHVFPEAAP